MISGIRFALLQVVVTGFLAVGVHAEAPDKVDFPKLRPSTKPVGTSLSRYVREVSPITDLAAVLIDVDSGGVIETMNATRPLTPASVTKVITALYGIDRLGPDYRYNTTVLATGPIHGGLVRGDIVLVGGGDPALDSDELAVMIEQLSEKGIKGVTGKLLYDATFLPEIFQIHPLQPPHAAYNPSISALNMNFNRVYFDWDLKRDEGALGLFGRAERHAPETRVVSVSQVNRAQPSTTTKHAEGAITGPSQARR